VKHWKTRKLKRPWGAVLILQGEALTLGSWPTRKAAAEAYDRAARYYGLGPERLNFPERRLRPADAATLRLEAKKKRKFSSRYRGVTWSKAAQSWIATVHGRVKGQKVVEYVGTFDSEKEAAKARDREARRLLGRAAQLNFDPRT